MNIEELREYCMDKISVEETFPFGEDTLVFKVMGKAFLLTGLGENPLSFNVKCDPEKAVQLREEYNCVQPGYHMNKKHWNTIEVDGSVPDRMLREWIDHSYEQVCAGLSKRVQEKILKDEEKRKKKKK
ncbi:MAG: MmcQ/YjbR family DNA-binding protein [Bacteroidia bacterium]